MLTVLGIDPGSVRTGYGLIKTDGVRSFHLLHGHWLLPEAGADQEFNQRLGKLFRLLDNFITEHSPDEIAIEQVFVSQNPQSALKLGQARGAALSAVVNRQLPIHEYSPRSVKQAITGSGAADKNQVGEMVKRLLHLKSIPQADAADALAIALCHIHSRVQPGGLAAGLSARTRTGGARRSRRWTDIPGKIKQG